MDFYVGKSSLCSVLSPNKWRLIDRFLYRANVSSSSQLLVLQRGGWLMDFYVGPSFPRPAPSPYKEEVDWWTFM